MAERIDRTLAGLRALLARADQRHLEPDDWAVVDALISELIDQAEPGREDLIIELSDEEEASGWKTRGAVGAEDSTCECESKRDVSGGARRLDAPR